MLLPCLTNLPPQQALPLPPLHPLVPPRRLMHWHPLPLKAQMPGLAQGVEKAAAGAGWAMAVRAAERAAWAAPYTN